MKKIQPLLSNMEKLKDFTPFASAKQEAAVAEAATRKGRSLSHWNGLLYGLSLSLHASTELLTEYLELGQEPPEVREAIEAYASALWARLNVDDADVFDASVDPATVTNAAQAEEWLRGLAEALQLDPEPLRLLTHDMAEIIGENVVSSMLLVTSFMDLGEVAHTRAAELQELQDVRAGALKQMAQATPEAMAHTLQLILLDVDHFYGFSALVSQLPGVEQALGKLSGRAKQMPVQRESRKIRPNEPCPCGSGKKYKKCHGAPGAPALP